MTDLMNKAQVAELFQREAVLLGSRDVMPEVRAIELFGVRAVNFAKQMRDTHETCVGYGADGYIAFGLNLYGVQLAASYCNVRLLQKKEAMNSGE